MFQFTDDCLIGIQALDDDHRYLFELINRVMELLKEEPTDEQRTQINAILDKLTAYADHHFIKEEEYMEQIRDPELLKQRAQHDFFRQKVAEMQQTYKTADFNQTQLLTDLMNFLAKWLYRHILGSDIMIGKMPAADEWLLRDNPCEFTDEFRTGIELIDSEHQELFHIIERANSLVKAFVADSYDEIMGILEELKNYTKSHFADEEEYMESIHYEGLEAQKRAHAAFIERLEEIDPQEIDENPQEYLNELLEFLLNWLINHILYSDKKIPDVTK